MSFPLEKHEEWHLKFDYIQFPNCEGNLFENINISQLFT